MSESHLATRNSVKDLPPNEALARPGHAREDLLRLLPPETGLPRPVQAGSLPPALATLGLLDARERDVDPYVKIIMVGNRRSSPSRY